MARKKNIPVNYTSRDFDTIKNDLIEHAKRYYPDVYRDFSRASFGSFLMDIVAYVGDVMSFYADFQANEAFMETSIQPANVIRHAKNLGYEFEGSKVTYGSVSLFLLVPSNSDGSAPDFRYMPVLKKGATFSSTDGTFFTLMSDVVFSLPKNDIVAAQFDSSSGNTTFYAVRAHGAVRSGIRNTVVIDLNNETFARFRRVYLGNNTLTDVESCIDTEGNEWYQVEHLTQEVVYKEVINSNAKNDGVPSILKPIVSARRFKLSRDENGVYAQFGFGNEESDVLTGIVDPSRVSLNIHGKRNISTTSFDPSELISTDKLGLSPSGKTLNFTCNFNTIQLSSIAAGTLTTAIDSTFVYDNLDSLDSAMVDTVNGSLEINNEDPINGGGITASRDEIKIRAMAHYARQNRAVTAKDYESLIYQMPGNFGSIKRCAVVGDPHSSNKRVSVYLISEDSEGKLVSTNDIVKQNIKSWISKYKPMNDVVEMLDAKVVNFGIEFHAISSPTFDQSMVMSSVIDEINKYFEDIMDIGEPIYISSLWSVINKVEGIVDLKKLKIFNKSKNNYSENLIDFDDIMSRDGTYIKTPKNVIMELKFPTIDIKGVIK